jgi:hypothetical protein
MCMTTSHSGGAFLGTALQISLLCATMVQQMDYFVFLSVSHLRIFVCGSWTISETSATVAIKTKGRGRKVRGHHYEQCKTGQGAR